MKSFHYDFAYMSIFPSYRLLAQCRLSCLFTVLSILSLGMGRGQVSPEEHAQHHPEESQEEQSTKPDKSKESGMGGGGMDKMMEKMGTPQPTELYPSLMSLPDLSMEKRAELQQQAHNRMEEGTALMADALQALSQAAPTENFAAMQEATAKLREGLARFESGLATHRALTEGKSPRGVALQWFKREMNLTPMPSVGTPDGPFGFSWPHFLVMTDCPG